MMLSIIIPAHNEAALLPATLSSVERAAAALDEPFELIVVNDDSTDETARIAAQLGAAVINVNRRNIAAVRNEGAAAAQGEWFAFLDADTELTPAVLRAARRAIDDGAMGGGSAVRFSSTPEAPVPLYARLVTAIMVPLFRWSRTAAGCFMFARRSAFEQIGGFDETLYASEEIAFSKAMRRHGRFTIIREAVTTSSRKLHAYSPWHMLAIIARQALRGPRGAWRSREGLDFWYSAPRSK